jgi:hypothetical protein
MPFSFLVSLIPFIIGKPTLLKSIEYLENSIKELKGRLYLVMEPFQTPFDSKKYREKSIRDCLKILEGRKVIEFCNFKIGLNYIIIPIILLFLLFIFRFHIKILNPHPAISYIKEITEENRPTLILAECPELQKLFLFHGNNKERMLHLGNKRFALLIKPKYTTEVTAGYRSWKSESREIKVIPTLRVDELSLEYKFPDYLDISPLYDTILEPNDKILIRVLSGTKAKFYGKTNKVLGGINGNFEKGNVTGNSFSGILSVKEDIDIKVELIDTFYQSKSNIHFNLRPIIDDPPSIEFISPVNNFKLDEKMEVPIKLRAKDDFGLSLLKLLYEEEEIDLGDAMGERFLLDSLNIEVKNLLPGETLKVSAAAYDLAGNKTLTPPLIIFMPTLPEMLSHYSDFSDTLSKVASDLQKNQEELIEKIEEYILKSELNHESRYGIKETFEEQKELLREIEKMVELAEKMDHPLITEELNRINELLDELGINEFYKKLENIEKSEDFTDRRLRDLNISQEKLLETLKLGRKSLQSLKEFIELNEFLTKAEEIYTEQNEIAKGTPNDSLATLEEELKEKLSELTEEMKNSPNDEIKKLTNQFENTETEQKMIELANKMRQGKIDEITLEEIKKALLNLFQNLNNMCACRTGENIIKAIQQKGWELGFILRRHSNLIDRKPGILEGLTEQGLSEGVIKIEKELEELFLLSFAFTPEVLTNLMEASISMEELGKELSKVKPLHSSMDRIKNLLIESIIGLFSLPPKSSEAMMNAMNEILGEQQSISEQLQQIIPLPGNRGMEILSELAQKQRSLAKRLRELGEVLEPVAQDMEEAANRMEMGELDKRVLDRQMKLLDRLLEASKSIRRKDISKKRRSRPGIFVSPPMITLPEDLGEKKIELQKLLEKRMKEPYPEAYEKEIERYIRRLLK